MKKLFAVVLVLGLTAWFGCHLSKPSIEIVKVNDVAMAPVGKLSEMLGLKYTYTNDEVTIKQDGITLIIKPNLPYVYKDGYIMYVMQGVPIKENDQMNISLDFFTDYLEADLYVDNKNRVQLLNQELSLYNVVKFLPKEVLGALYDNCYPYRDKILKAVELPRSMNIETPKLNNEKIVHTVSLDELSSVFKNELRQHGYSDEDIAGFSFNDYNVLHKTWKLDAEMISLTKSQFAELNNEDLTSWTYGDFQDYQSTHRGSADITEQQKVQLNDRRILIEDVPYLLKDFYSIDAILSQPDQVLKKKIEENYQVSIDMLGD